MHSTPTGADIDLLGVGLLCGWGTGVAGFRVGGGGWREGDCVG